MVISPGTFLGPYEILALLGAGGMGEVHRARDPRIGREVAIKILPAAFARDPDRLRRFEQEVQAAGALNHPNILVIHDVGTQERSPYIVSELLEGETLRERLGAAASATALPSRKAIEYALGIAHGLAAAHAKGIVHRDLKPENIFLTKDGRIKILDFGLAKLLERQAPDGTSPDGATLAAANAPTVAEATDPGVVLGTAGYMSPEQARGKPADHRADIFSFGAILYEMLSGRRAFRGESAIETLNAIIKDEPPELSHINPNISPAIERIVRHCLEKNPEQRFQSAQDLAFNLEAAFGVSTSTVAAAGLPEKTVSVRKPRLLAALAVTAIVAAAAGFLAGSRLGLTPVSRSPVYHRLTFRSGRVGTARFSSDGKTILYGAAWGASPVSVFMTRPESPESEPLGLADADLLSISPSGELALSLHRRYLEAFETRGTLARRPFVGGAPRQVLDNVIEAEWAPASSRESTLAVVRRVGGECRLEFPIGNILYRTAGLVSHIRFSPKGDGVAFLNHPRAEDDAGSVAVTDLAGHVKTLSEGWETTGGLAWSPDGSEIWVTGSHREATRTLYAINLSGKERLVLGDCGDVTLADIARDGRVLLTHESVWRGFVGSPAGEGRERDLSWFDRSAAWVISPNGKTVLFSETGAGAASGYQCFLRPMDGSPPVRLGPGVATSLSPDGQWVLALQVRSSELMLLPTGSGEPKLIRSDAVRYGPATWLPDGRRIVTLGVEPGHGARCYITDRNSAVPRGITPEGLTWKPVVSPDGQWVAFTLAQGGVNLFPVEGGSSRQIPGTSGDNVPIEWSSDGRSLFVYTRGELPAQIDRLDLATGRKDPWKQITPSDPNGIHLIGPVVITPDGKSYVYTYRRILSDLYLVEGLK